MKRIFFAIVALLSLGSFAIPAYSDGNAATPIAVGTIANNLAAHNWQSYEWIEFCGYNTCNDGGQGTFHKETCTPDGGLCLADGSGNTFARQNANGDLAQFGLTAGSAYDAKANPTTVSGASNIIANAFTSLAAIGMTTLHTRQVSLKIGTSLSVPTKSTLTCDAVPQVLNAGNFKNLPGTLWLSPGASIIAPDRSTVPAANCNILPYWYLNPAVATFANGNTSITTPPANFADVEGIRQNTIAAGDVAIECDADNCQPHDDMIAGFDTGLYGSRSSHLNAINLDIDANVCVYGFSGGGQTDYNSVNCEPVLTKQPTHVDNEEYWSITGLAASGTHTNAAGDAVCQFTLANGVDKTTGLPTPYDTHDIHTSVTDAQGSPISYPAWTANIKTTGKSTGCNLAGGAVSVISATGTGSGSTAVVDILGSDFGGPTVKGQWASGVTLVYVRGSTQNIHVGQTVTSSGTGFPAGTITVVGVLHGKGQDPSDAFGGEVLLSAPTTGAQATDVNIGFANPAFSASGSACDGGKNGFCFFLNTAERKYAGNSVGGIASATLPSSHGVHYGASFFFSGVAGPRLVNAFAYGHHYGYVLLNSNNASIVQEAGDDNGELDDGDQVYFEEIGGSNSATITTNKNSKTGTSIIDDTFQVNDDAVSTTSSTISGLGTGTGNLAVVSTTGFLANGGTAAICVGTIGSGAGCDTDQAYEYVNYTVVDGTHLNINLRGQFATAPQTFAGTVTLFNEIVSNSKGCVSILGVNTPVTTSYLNAYELNHGCLQLTNTRGNGSGFGFVSHNASAFQSIGNFNSSITQYFEDSTARGLSNSVGNTCVVLADCNDLQYVGVTGASDLLGGVTIQGLEPLQGRSSLVLRGTIAPTTPNVAASIADVQIEKPTSTATAVGGEQMLITVGGCLLCGTTGDPTTFGIFQYGGHLIFDSSYVGPNPIPNIWEFNPAQPTWGPITGVGDHVYLAAPGGSYCEPPGTTTVTKCEYISAVGPTDIPGAGGVMTLATASFGLPSGSPNQAGSTLHSRALVINGTPGTASGGASLDTFGILDTSTATNQFAGINRSSDGNGWEMLNTPSTSTTPTVIPDRSNATTGLGSHGSGAWSLTANGTETMTGSSTTVTFLEALAMPDLSQWSTTGLSEKGYLQVGSQTPMTLAAGELGLIKIAASGSAPGATGLKLEGVCGTGAGSMKIIAYAGTSTTPVTIIDNVGSGVTGC